MSRFSLVWISAKEQLDLEVAITEILTRLKMALNYFVDENSRNKSFEDKELYGGRLKFQFTGGWIHMILTTTSRTETPPIEVHVRDISGESIICKLPEGVKLTETVEYVLQRIRQFMIFSVSMTGYDFEVHFGSAQYDAIDVEWKKEE